MDEIIIRGARVHNLKNVDLALPRQKLIVITGVSGSGKSSLAFDTLFAEGERRYMEALSSFARHFLQRLDAPDVDEIVGLSPAIAIQQKGPPRSPRSTVGTLTEIHDHLRLLFSRLGTVYCPDCNLPIKASTISQMFLEMAADWPEGSRALILAPLDLIKEKHLPATLKKLRKEGFARIRLEGQIYELEPAPRLPRRAVYALEVVVDRLVLSEAKGQRFKESLELASKLGRGMVKAVRMEGGEMQFSELFRCTSCGRQMAEPTPSLFSFHHPAGLCPSCRGFGSVSEAAAESARTESGSEEAASDRDEIPALPFLSHEACPVCQGSRLNLAARSVRLGGRSIDQISQLPVNGVRLWLQGLDLSPSHQIIAERPMREIRHRLDVMDQLGLSYLTLDRSAVTISGGEAQRIRLANQIGTPLAGVLYVLDEPSIGLHPRDHERLLNILFRLRDEGNTLVVVEHDRETILRADYVVDMGPGAGRLGGQVLYAGTPEGLLGSVASLTGAYLSNRKRLPAPPPRTPFLHGALTISGARSHNLKDITVSFPLGCITCVTGVSGSGKSSLVMHTLLPAISAALGGRKSHSADFRAIDGARSFRKVIVVDQSPIGRTPRSNPATYAGIFGMIRQVFSQVPEARARGYSPNRFSFNVKGGRCELCKGDGLQRVEMYFLPDVYVTCPECNGLRYNDETLQILFKGHSIADVLEFSVQEAAGFFENLPAIRHRLSVLQEVGLGYLRLGQPATTLSGGEAQRIKLGTELARKTISPALYILDEPTTGLHFEDIERLMHVLQRLADQGHTIILIEHHPDVILAADYVIDLGPEGGDEGGFVVAAGAPLDVAAEEASHTSRFLRRALSRA